MKKILFLTVGLLLSLGLNAQTPDVVWQKIMGGTLSDQANDIQQTSDGGYIIAASSESQDGDVGSTNGDYDFWVIKLNAAGELEWKNNFGGSDWDLSNAIRQTSDGGYVVIGYTYSDDFDVTGMNGFRDSWVVKINSTGVLQWQKALGGSGADSAEDVIENTDGYLVLGFDGGSNDGDLQGTGCKNDFWIIQLSFSGEIMWQKCYGGTDIEKAKKIIPAGINYLIVGSASSSDGDVTVNYGYDDMWVIQIDPLGNLIWQKSLGGSDTDIATDAYFASVGPTEQIVIIGTTYSSDGDISSNHGGLDYWMVTLDPSLNIINEKTFGGSLDEEAYSVLPTKDGHFIISGSTQSSDGDVTDFIGGADAWLVQVDYSTNLIWSKCVGGSKGDVTYASIASANDDGFLFAGWTTSNEFSGYQGNGDMWIVKLGESSSAIGTIPVGTNGLKIFPNPGVSTSTIYIEHNLENAQKLIVRNIAGQINLERSINGNGKQIGLSLDKFLTGTYVIEVHGVQGVQIGKLVIM